MRGSITLLVVTLVLLWIGFLDLITLSAKAASPVLCLFLGLLCGTIYSILETYSPGSFTGELLTGAGTPIKRLHYFYYFSYITLTTLGYGDILPQSRLAAGMCQVEAILGQFFTAVLVARLVGIQVSQQFSTKTDN